MPIPLDEMWLDSFNVGDARVEIGELRPLRSALVVELSCSGSSSSRSSSFSESDVKSLSGTASNSALPRIDRWFATRSGRKELSKTKEEPRLATLTIVRKRPTRYMPGYAKMKSIHAIAPM